MKLNFKQKVLRTVARIPKGKIMTHKEIAGKAGRPWAYRAAANILAKNRNPKIPCHRVIKLEEIGPAFKGGEGGGDADGYDLRDLRLGIK
jgi:O-6-methylguanine DNA methyltransferase